MSYTAYLPSRSTNPVIRVLLAVAAVTALAALAFFGFMIFLGLLAVGAVWLGVRYLRLRWHAHKQARQRDENVLDGEYIVVEKREPRD